MRERLVSAVERAWYGSPGWFWLLLPVEGFFSVVTALRRWAYRRGWRKSVHPGVPVIIIGNLSVGGTGKTPTVIALVRELSARGLQVAVISRGYGRDSTGTVAERPPGSNRQQEKAPIESQSSGVLRLSSTSLATQVGDEPLLIKQSTDAEVFVGDDRVDAAQTAAANGAQVIVSDDGLQHYRLARDVEVVTMASDGAFGNGHLLPVGPLREPRRRLSRVDFLLMRDGRMPATRTRYRPTVFRQHGTGEQRSAKAHGFAVAVHAVAAIARPQRFFDTLRGLGLTVIEHAFPDHHAFAREDFASLTEGPVIITEKDAVKLPPLSVRPWVLEMELQLPDGFVDAVLDRLNLADGVAA